MRHETSEMPTAINLFMFTLGAKLDGRFEDRSIGDSDGDERPQSENTSTTIERITGENKLWKTSTHCVYVAGPTRAHARRRFLDVKSPRRTNFFCRARLKRVWWEQRSARRSSSPVFAPAGVRAGQRPGRTPTTPNGRLDAVGVASKWIEAELIAAASLPTGPRFRSPKSRVCVCVRVRARVNKRSPRYNAHTWIIILWQTSAKFKMRVHF